MEKEPTQSKNYHKMLDAFQYMCDELGENRNDFYVLPDDNGVWVAKHKTTHHADYVWEPEYEEWHATR